MSFSVFQRQAFVVLASAVTMAGLGCSTNQELATVPAGTQMEVALQTPLSTATAEEGQRFTATTTSPLVVKGRTIVASGTTVRGTVTEVTNGDDNEGPSMTLEFDELMAVNGKSHSFDAEPIEMVSRHVMMTDHDGVDHDADNNVGHNVDDHHVVGTTRATTHPSRDTMKGTTYDKEGSILGHHHNDRTVVIGGQVGAGAGGVWTIETLGDQIVLERGQRFRVEINESTDVPVRAGM